MTYPANRPPQLIPDSPTLQKLRSVLQKSGYFESGIAPTIQDIFPEIPPEIPVRSRLHTLIKMFYRRELVSPELARNALSPLSLEELLSTGFCRIEGTQVVGSLLLQPCGEHCFAVGALTETPGPDDRVMQISGSSLELANLINPRHALKALDLGTGCGFLATLVSPQAERVYAVDLSPAAVRLAEFNARWNALSNIACLQGDLFGPVRGLRFDLIVCNPPFFICPVADAEMNRLIFQHSGQQGDTFCVQLARDACEFLEEDGFFHMMFSWMQKDGQDWRARLEPAFTGIGCDVWCLRIDERSAEDYVWAWCAGLEEIPGADLDDLRRKAMAYFQKENVSAIGTGLLTLRRRTSRPNQLWFDDAPEDRSEPYGDSVANLFEVRVNVGSLPDAELLRQKVTCAPDLGIVRKSTRKGRRWEVIASEFCCNSGLKYTFEGIDDPLVEIVNQLDGHSSLREILTKVARKRREPVNRLVRAYLPTLRELLWYGFVLPAPTVRSASRSGKPTRRSAR